MASDSSQYGFSDRYQTSESTPGSSSAVQGGSRAPVGGGGLGARRRKVPESVTLNACTNCKRARAKVFILDFLRLMNPLKDVSIV